MYKHECTYAMKLTMVQISKIMTSGSQVIGYKKYIIIWASICFET